MVQCGRAQGQLVLPGIDAIAGTVVLGLDHGTFTVDAEALAVDRVVDGAGDTVARTPVWCQHSDQTASRGGGLAQVRGAQEVCVPGQLYDIAVAVALVTGDRAASVDARHQAIASVVQIARHLIRSNSRRHRHQGLLQLGAGQGMKVLGRAVDVQLVQRRPVRRRAGPDVPDDTFVDPPILSDQRILVRGAGGVVVFGAVARRVEAVQRRCAGPGRGVEITGIAFVSPALRQQRVPFAGAHRVEMVVARGVRQPVQPRVAGGLRLADKTGHSFVAPPETDSDRRRESRALGEIAVTVIKILRHAARAVRHERQPVGSVVDVARIAVLARVADEEDSQLQLMLGGRRRQRLRRQVEPVGMGNALDDVAVGVVLHRGHCARAVDRKARAAERVVNGAGTNKRRIRHRRRFGARCPADKAIDVCDPLGDVACRIALESDERASAIHRRAQAAVVVVEVILDSVWSTDVARPQPGNDVGGCRTCRQAGDVVQRHPVLLDLGGAAQDVVRCLLHIADRVDLVDQLVARVVNIAHGLPVAIDRAHHVAVRVVFVACGQVQAGRRSGRIHRLPGTPPQAVVGVGCQRAVRVDRAQGVVARVVGERRHQVQAAGVDGLPGQPALQVECQARDLPVRIRHAHLPPPRVVLVVCGQGQALGIHNPGQEPVDRVIAQSCCRAVGVRGFDQPVRAIVGAGGQGQRRRRVQQLAIPVVAEAGCVPQAVRHALGLAQPGAHGGDGDVLRRRHRHAACRRVVAVPRGLVEGIRLAHHPVEGVISRDTPAIDGLRGQHHPAQAVIGLGANVLVGVATQHRPAEGVVVD